MNSFFHPFDEYVQFSYAEQDGHIEDHKSNSSGVSR